MAKSLQTGLHYMIVFFAVLVELTMCIEIHPLLDCKRSRYGCCPDGVTDALGWNQKGCSALLCYDQDKLCEKLQEEGDCKSLDKWQIMTEMCPKSCGRCANGQKVASPSACYKAKYGCCYDGLTAAVSEDKRPGVGCPYCRNMYPHTCKQFGSNDYCKGNWPRTRHFLKNYCFKQCGICTNFQDLIRPSEIKDWRKKYF